MTAMKLGVCYYPEHWPETLWEQDAQEMHELGLTYVRIGEFAWSRIEPEAGRYEFAWLDKSIQTLSDAGLKIVFGLPTATPPKWLIDKFPDILAVDPNTGITRGFGSRRHYDFSSQDYRRECNRINTEILKRYGSHESIVAWQTDNELGCHDTTLSASSSAKMRFREWCKRRYQTIEALNTAWGTVFWSMEYTDFSQIELPVLTVTEAQPAHQLAYRRFASDELISFQQDQIDLIRAYASQSLVTHNFIPMSDTDADNFEASTDLDFVSFDNYPLGRTDLFFADLPQSETEKYQRTGHPDFQSYYFDNMRGMNRDSHNKNDFWIMEQQPGPVNWARYNPRPAPGMVRLWSVEAFAHGAECVSYFRWRQIPFAQEQMHAAIKRRDNSKSDTWFAALNVQKELEALKLNLRADIPAKVAILTDADARAITRIERQSDAYDYEKQEFSYYSALRQLGVDVDFVSTQSDFSNYALVVAPSLPVISKELIKKIEASSAHWVFGPRSGSKTNEFSLPENLAPSHLQNVLPVKITSVETTHPDYKERLTLNFLRSEKAYTSEIWREELQSETLEVLAKYADGSAAIVANDKVTYIGTVLDADGLKDSLLYYCQQHDVETFDLPRSVRLCRRDGLVFAFNYGEQDAQIDLDVTTEFVIGEQIIPAYDFSVWKA